MKTVKNKILGLLLMPISLYLCGNAFAAKEYKIGVFINNAGTVLQYIGSFCTGNTMKLSQTPATSALSPYLEAVFNNESNSGTLCVAYANLGAYVAAISEGKAKATDPKTDRSAWDAYSCHFIIVPTYDTSKKTLNFDLSYSYCHAGSELEISGRQAIISDDNGLVKIDFTLVKKAK